MVHRHWLCCVAVAVLVSHVSTTVGQSAAVEPLVFKGHTNSVLTVAFSPDGKALATAGMDKSVKLWDPRTGESIAVLNGHRCIVKSLAFTPDGKTLISGAGQSEGGKFSGELKAWEIPRGRLKRTVPMKPNNDVNAVACFPDGKLVASGGIDGINVWDIETGELKKSLPTDNSATLALAISPEGKTLVTGSFDTLLRLWDPRTWTVKQTFTDHRSEIRATKLSADGKTLAAYTGGRKEAYLWDLDAGKLQRTINNEFEIEALAISRDGRTLATAGHHQATTTGRVDLWDVSTGRHRGTFADDNGPVFALDFSPDGKMLATGGGGKIVKLWSLSK